MNNDLIAKLKENWFLLLFVGGIIASWTKFSADLNQLRIETAANSAKIASTDSSLATVYQSLAGINVKLDFLIKGQNER